MRTKAEILLAKRAYLAETLAKLDREIAGLKSQHTGGGDFLPLQCGKCGAVHETEWDFASHYVVSDERYLNLGDCPDDPRNSNRVTVDWVVTTKFGGTY